MHKELKIWFGTSETGGEGIAAAKVGETVCPLVVFEDTPEEVAAKIEQLARVVAENTNETLTLRVFEFKRIVKEIRIQRAPTDEG